MVHDDEQRQGPMGLERGLDILETLAQAGQGMRFTDLQRRLGIAKPVLSRLLKSLHARGYIIKEGSSRAYVRGPALQRLSRGLEWLPYSRKALAQAAQPIIDQLLEEYQQTTMALHWNGQQLESVATATADEGMAPWPVGTRRDQFQRGPWGVVVLAESGEDPRPRVAEDPKSLPLEVLLAAIERVRAQGWLLLEKAHCLRYAVPLRAGDGRLVGVLGVFANPAMLDPAARLQLGEAVVAAAASISEQLGWRRQDVPSVVPSTGGSGSAWTEQSP